MGANTGRRITGDVGKIGMRILQTTREMRRKMLFTQRMFLDADMVIVDGVIVKNRNGDVGEDIGMALVIWDEELWMD
jgi:hypothetical protein